MKASNLLPLMPFIAIASGTVAVMLVRAFRPRHRDAFWLSIVTLATTFAVLAIQPSLPEQATPLLILDGLSIFLSQLIVLSTGAVALLSRNYLKKTSDINEEYYIILLTASLGALVLVNAAHFASFFLGLEVLSVSLYTLVAFQRASWLSAEAGIKYLILAGGSSAFLLFGLALEYVEFGTMDFASLATQTDFTILSIVGIVLTLVGVGFKLGVVPFHMWTADVYEGAPAPISGFIATVSKGAMFGLLLRYLPHPDTTAISPVLAVLAIIAVASMLAGNLLALLQDNVKRLLAYSSIAHMGYLIVAFLSVWEQRAAAVTFYLVAYFITTLGAFGVVSALTNSEGEATSIVSYRGLIHRKPWLAAVMTLMLLSLAGIPLTAGFVAKFYAVSAGVGSSLWLLVVTLAAGSAMGLYYYLRFMVILYLPAAEGDRHHRPVTKTESITLGALTLALLWLGLYPDGLLAMIKSLSNIIRNPV